MRSAIATLTPAATKDVAPRTNDPHSTFTTVLVKAPVTADLERSYLSSQISIFRANFTVTSFAMRRAFLARVFPFPFIFRATRWALIMFWRRCDEVAVDGA